MQQEGEKQALTPQEVHLQPGPQLQLLGPLQVHGPFILRRWNCLMNGVCGVKAGLLEKAIEVGFEIQERSERLRLCWSGSRGD